MSNSTTVVIKLNELLRTNAEIVATEKALADLRAKSNTLQNEAAEALQQIPGVSVSQTYRVRANYENYLVGYRINQVSELPVLILVTDHADLSSL